MSKTSSREIHLVSRPVGMPTAANFAIADVQLPDPAPGQMLVRNLYLSVDPYMRGRMVDRKSYVPPFQVGEVMTGGAVGQVIFNPTTALFPRAHTCSACMAGANSL